MATRTKSVKTIFVCQNCGNEFPRWAGKCLQCGEWNSLVEEKVQPAKRGARVHAIEQPSESILLNDIQITDSHRIKSNLKEFDRVLGGGLVPGSLVLNSGDPGIGKSTLLLQVLSGYAKQGHTVLYVSGEESLQQVKMRAVRLGINPENLYIYSGVDIYQVLAEIQRLNSKIVVIDSIQTMFNPEFDSAPGSVTQVRESAMALLQLAKSKEISILLVGHVTKDGGVAGPRVLEHMVDVMLFLEGDRHYQYRILRGIKNRFGSTNEIGVFELNEEGMVEIENPSQLFLSGVNEEISGSTITCAIEGTRPILFELQALTTSTSFGMAQRTASGIDQKRLALLLAILEKRMGYHVGEFDVFVKLAGGLRIEDPSVDLAILMAIASSYKDRILNSKSLFLGEVGLGGEIRAISQLESRLKEADLLGFHIAYVPKQKRKALNLKKLKVVELENIRSALTKFNN